MLTGIEETLVFATEVAKEAAIETDPPPEK